MSDGLFQRVKQRAVKDHTSFTAIIESALRRFLDKAGTSRKKRDIAIPTGGSGGLQPGVDLDNTADLLDRMEGRA